MTKIRLRIALTALSAGFALEGLGELYTLSTPGSTHVGVGVLFVLPAALAIVGLAVMWAGRSEWATVHWARAQAASRVFLASVWGGVVASGVIAILLYDPSLGMPWWAPVLFGVGLGAFVWGTTVTYAYLLFDLLSRPMRRLVVAAIAWALFVSAIVGAELAANLGAVLTLVRQPTLTIPAYFGLVDATVSWLFVTFFLLLVASIQAHISVARGRLPDRRAADRRTSLGWKPLEPQQND